MSLLVVVVVGVALSSSLIAHGSALSSSSLIAGGAFSSSGDAGGLASIAHWNGSHWTALGAGLNDQVLALAAHEGAWVAGGAFTSPARHVARWTGTAWAALGPGLDNWVCALAIYQDDTRARADAAEDAPVLLLVAGGHFRGTDDGAVAADYVAAWDGTAWSALGRGVDGAVYALAVYDGRLVVGGYFATAGGGDVSAPAIAQWDGAAWTALGAGLNGAVRALAVYDGALVVGGLFSTAGGAAANKVARWTGGAWAAMGTSGFTGGTAVYALEVGSGDVVAGGDFEAAGAVSTRGIARWNRSTALWESVGTGLGNPGTTVFALAALGPGTVVAGGSFLTAGSVSANRTAQWNGTWSPLALGLGGTVRALLVAPTETPPPEECSLDAFDWHAQYYQDTDDGAVLVSDDLTFQRDADAAPPPRGAFEQNTTAFPFQPCWSNWVAWRGEYEQVNATTVLMSYMRCTVSAVGCLACTPTSEVWVGLSFSADCATLVLRPSDGAAPRTYFPAKQGLGRRIRL